jgi:hypothetical protein
LGKQRASPKVSQIDTIPTFTGRFRSVVVAGSSRHNRIANLPMFTKSKSSLATAIINKKQHIFNHGQQSPFLSARE